MFGHGENLKPKFEFALFVLAVWLLLRTAVLLVLLGHWSWQQKAEAFVIAIGWLILFKLVRFAVKASR
jgi:hypothetical protein